MATKTPSRFPVGGLTTAAQTDPLGLFGLPDPTKWIVYWNDMCNGWDTIPNATDQNYTVTKTGAGTVAAADGLGGWAVLTNAAADNDAVFIQRKGEAFRWSSSKRMFFEARLKVSDATESDVVVGLQITDTTPLDVTDGFFFLKADGAATVDFLVEKNNTASSATACATMVSDTFIKLGFAYNGRPEIVAGVATYQFQVFVDGVFKTYVNATTNVCDDEDLCISFGVQNGEAVAKSLTVDYIFAALER